MMEYNDKEVNFNEYCAKCRYRNLKEDQDPCDRCLEDFVKQNSTKPTYFKEGVFEDEE